MTRGKKHPYQDLESLEAWGVLERGIEALVKNGDLAVTTAPPYVVGYLLRRLAESGDLRDQKPRRVYKSMYRIVLLKPFRKRVRAKSLL